MPDIGDASLPKIKEILVFQQNIQLPEPEVKNGNIYILKSEYILISCMNQEKQGQRQGFQKNIIHWNA